MSASPSVRHSFSDIGNLSAVMSLRILDLPTPISEKVAILRPSSLHRDLILIDLSANVNSRTLFGPFTVTPPRLVGPDQSPIFEPEAASSSILENHHILAATWRVMSACHSGPSDGSLS
jgi:hypothetical protein